MLRSALLRGNRCSSIRGIVRHNGCKLVQGQFMASISASAVCSLFQRLNDSQCVWVLPRLAALTFNQRSASDKKPDENLLPGSSSVTQPSDLAAPPKLSSSIVLNQTPLPSQPVPKPPPSPFEAAEAIETAAVPSEAATGRVNTTAQLASSSPSSSLPPPSPVTRSPPRKRSRLLRFLINLVIISTLGYGLGVYYALISDNWHDFFTEYVPFGEDAVAYFEEREFRKRLLQSPLPNLKSQTQADGNTKVTIPGRAGVSSRKLSDSDLAAHTEPHINAVEESHKLQSHPQTVQAQNTDRQPISSTRPGSIIPLPQHSTGSDSEPAPVAHIDNLNIPLASEPVVQSIVKILNDLITVINADKAGSKYASSIDKARADLNIIVSHVQDLKQEAKQAADKQAAALHVDFDAAAKELLRRSEEQVGELEMKWREEYEAERANLAKQYENKLGAELASANHVSEEKLENELLKHTIALHRQFSTSVEEAVENEREGRLSKLGELSSRVAHLQRLTADWNSVLDSTLHTQHLHVAVDAVKSLLEKSDRPKPFVDQLAALKEVAADNPVVNAAIASINPVAYQRGISPLAHLIDRFRRVASEVRKAALLPDDAGVASHAASLVLSKFMFKKEGLPTGDDVESILTRAEMFLEEANVDGAVREMNSLTGWAKTLSRDWLSECRRVLEVQQALDIISTEARLRSLLVD